MYPFRTRTHLLVKEAQKLAGGASSDESDVASESTDYIPDTESESHNGGDTDDSDREWDKLLDNGRIVPYGSRSFETTDENLPCKSSNDEMVSENVDQLDHNSQEIEKDENCSGIENIKSKNVLKRVRRKHSCIYCDLTVTNFARHLERNHSEEIEVQQCLRLGKNNLERKHLIDKLRKEGDFCTGNPIPVLPRKSGGETQNLLPCIFCKGYYAKKTLRRHAKRCPFNNEKAGPSRYQVRGQNLLVKSFGPNDILRTSGVLESLAADEISLVAKRDKIICEVARQYLKSHKDKHLSLVAKRQMRRLSRLLIATRKIENDDKLTLLSILHPSKFKSIVEAVRAIGKYDWNSKCFASPSLALQMGTLLKKAISVAYSMLIQKDVNSTDLSVLNAMKTLINDQWASEVSTEASQNLNVNRFNKPTLIPMAEDIAKMKKYLDDLIEQTTNQLQESTKGVKAYRNLIEAVYCSVLLFNRRRVGELQRIPLSIYVKFNNIQSSAEFQKLLTPSEKILIKSLKRVVIRGKRGRGVPVLFEKKLTASIDLLIEKRHQYFHEHSDYLFGIPGTSSCINGYQVLRKHARLALGDVSKTKCLTSTRLRKHLATICQIFNMGKDELEQLAQFMGHTPKTHSEWYRLPSDVYQTAKVSKILLLSQSDNMMDQIKGKKINEIVMDDDLLENYESDESGGSETEFPEIDHSSIEGSRSENVIKRKSEKRKLIPWSTKEKKLTEEFFKKHIKSKIPPKKGEVMQLMSKYPDLFKNRNWATIKVFVQNKYTK